MSVNAFEDFCQKNLNDVQAKIVKQSSGIIVIHAGAGSGKTRIITARIVHLIQNCNVPPESIIALTFTNKAAREMGERVAHLLGSSDRLPYLGTFHAYCLRLLKTYRAFLETPDFTLIDDDDKEKLLKNLIERYLLNKKISASQVSGAISRIKNRVFSASINYDAIEDPFLRELLFYYEKEKTVSQLFDFDDLLLMTLKLLKTNSLVKETHQAHMRHILVDEYQDTNSVQYDLIKEMAINSKSECVLDSLCIVGDEDQSIYSWRGALAESMLILHRDFSQVETFTLDQNYRSVQPILNLANELIAHNKQRKPKNLWSDRPAQDRIRMITCASEYHEGEAIAQFCEQYRKTKRLKHCAVLYRSHYQSRILEEALIRNSLPYIIIGGIQFYERREIKDLLAYLKLMVNPFDRVSWLRAINTPARRLGEKFQELFITSWDSNASLNFKELAEQLILEHKITPSQQHELEKFIHLINECARCASVSETLATLLAQLNYVTYVKNTFDPDESTERIQNVKELVHAVEARQKDGTITVRDFLEEVALLQENMRASKREGDAVNLMTLHGAKGLEFDTVITTGLEEGILPSSRAYSDDAIEEERRLLYVGMTRAQERLILTRALYRYTYGSMNDQHISRFILDLKNEPFTCDDLSRASKHELQLYWSRWLNKDVHSEEQKSFKASRAHETRSNSPWRPATQVRHARYGVGTIEQVEDKGINDIYLSIRFDVGVKKIDASYVKLLDS